MLHCKQNIYNGTFWKTGTVYIILCSSAMPSNWCSDRFVHGSSAFSKCWQECSCHANIQYKCRQRDLIFKNIEFPLWMLPVTANNIQKSYAGYLAPHTRTIIRSPLQSQSHTTLAHMLSVNCTLLLHTCRVPLSKF